MDSKSSIINEIKGFLPFINEEFIVSISNKGIYKRSMKDLEKLGDAIVLSVKEAGIIAAEIEDVKVELNVNIQKSTCSCPSSSMCRHRIMTLLYLKEFYEKNQMGAEEEPAPLENPMEEYKELKELTSEKALEIIGKKNYNSLISSIFIRDEAFFEYGDMLTVTISAQNVRIFFPKENSIANSMCSCKEKGLCIHKAYAIISYLIKEGKLKEDDSFYESIEIGEKEKEFIHNLQKFISSIFDRGISGLTGNEISQTDKFYIQAYGLKFFALAEELKSLSSELGFYFTKNISFSNKRMLHNLCTMYNRATALLNVKSSKKKLLLAGQRQEEKFLLSRVNLTGLGAAGTVTKRGDLLLTGYFYCEDLKSILSMSTLRPMDSGVNIMGMYKMGQVWSNGYSFETVTTSKVVLSEAKLSTGKVSSAQSTVGTVKDKTVTADIENIAADDYQQVREEIKQHKFRYFEPYSSVKNIFLVKCNEIKDIEYDKIEQKLKFLSLDGKGNTITFEIKYNAVSERAIKYFESKRSRVDFEYILGSITEKKGELTGTFISCILDGKVANIFF